MSSRSIFHLDQAFGLITSQVITDWPKSMIKGSNFTVMGHRETCKLAGDLDMGV